MAKKISPFSELLVTDLYKWWKIHASDLPQRQEKIILDAILIVGGQVEN